MQKAIVILGMAGVGKTCLANKYDNILDFDYLHYKYIYTEEVMKSRSFEQLKGREEVRKINPLWPENYFNELFENVNKYKIILIPASPDVLDCLDEIKYDYMLCYPTLESKEIYMNRYKERGTNQEWIDKIDRNFADAIKKFNSRNCKKIILKNDETLEDKLIELGLLK